MMGLNLKLLPAYRGTEDFALTGIECSRESDFFNALCDLEKTKGWDCPPQGISFYNEAEGFNPENENAYGDRLRFLFAKDFYDLKPKYMANKAAMAYIRELPEDHKIYLYWH